MKKMLKRLYDAVPLKRELFSLLRAVVVMDKRLYRHLHFKGPFAVEVERGRSFVINHYGFELENDVFWRGLRHGWEKVSMGVWIELCRRSSVVLDVGANTGIYALVAKAMNPASRVYAFEPLQRVFRKLEENNVLNRYDIECLEVALSDDDGRAVVYDTDAEHAYSVTVNRNLHASGVDVVPTEVKTMKLSTFIRDRGLEKVDLIKIDVETHEPEVLRGMEGYLERFRPTLLIEILNDEVGKQVEEIVRGKGYLFFNIDELGGLRAVERITKSDFYNYLLCSREIAGNLGLPH